MDAHDLFRKLCKGVKFDHRSRQNPVSLTKAHQHIELKKTYNTAEEWLNPDAPVGDSNCQGREHETIKSEIDSCYETDSDDLSDPKTTFSDNLTDLDTYNVTESAERQFTYLGCNSVAVDNGIDFVGSKKKNSKNKLSLEEKLKAQSEERVNILRKQLRLSVSGGGVPDPVTSFTELQDRYKVPSVLVSNLLKSGYTQPTPIQAQAWPILLEKRQILACAPTGSGKTAAFLLPVLHHLRGLRRDGIRAVIVSPTRELAQQIYRECTRLAEGTGMNIHVISKVNSSRPKMSAESTRKYDVLVTTPNRLVFLLKQEPPVLSLHNVEWLVVDESDKLFEAGARGFRDQLATIYQACDSQNVKRAMFSATHGMHVANWCRKNLKGVIAVTVGHRNTAADEVEQELVYVGSEHGKLLAMRDMITKGLQPPVLIFVQSKERAKELFSELLYDGINVDVIHADRTQVQRDNVVRSFREGKIWVLICTELMGRGIDFKGVNLVINYDFPPSAVSYIHRIGRTGRAGRAGKAVTFFTAGDSALLRSIATVMRDSGCEVPQYMLDLKKVNKNARKKLENQAPERERISTAPLKEIRKKENIKRRIENEKRKKRGLPPLPMASLKGNTSKDSEKTNQKKKKKKQKNVSDCSEMKITHSKKKRKHSSDGNEGKEMQPRKKRKTIMNRRNKVNIKEKSNMGSKTKK